MSVDLRSSRLLSVTSALLTVPFLAAPALGAQAPAPQEPPTPESAEEFLDTRLPELMEEHDVPGVVAGIVADGEHLASSGHGYADLEAGIPFDPENAVVETASVAKSFTALAVLQLAEQHEIDLHGDINRYLPAEAQVPETHPDLPVTLHHVLTHTAGFEDRLTGSGTFDHEDHPTLSEYAENVQPERVTPPGRFTSYSNHGYALAGLAVEEVSGLPFEDYVGQHIFAPLGMDTTAFMHVDEARELHEVPRSYFSGDLVAEDFQLHTVPAGTAVTNVDDMAQFMLGLLEAAPEAGDARNAQGASGNDDPVLPTGAVEEMLNRQAGNDPGANGSGYGVFEYQREDPRIVGHPGSIAAVSNTYLLAPEPGVGLFVSVNGDDGAERTAEAPPADMMSAVLTEFQEEFDLAGAPPAVLPDPDSDLSEFVGAYVDTRVSYSEIGRVRDLIQTVTVSDRGDGSLTFGGHESTPDEAWYPVEGEENTFVSEDGSDQAVFTEEGGEYVAVSFDTLPYSTYERAGTFESPLLHLWTFLGAFLLLLTALIWPVAALIRRLRGKKSEVPAAAFRARVSATATTLCCVGLLVVASALLVNPNLLNRAMFTGSLALLLPLTLAAPFALTAGIHAVFSWTRGWWSFVGRVHYSLVAAAGLAFVGMGALYNLIWPLG